MEKRNNSNNGRFDLTRTSRTQNVPQKILKSPLLPGCENYQYNALLSSSAYETTLHIGTNDAFFLTPENMFKELQELRDFTLKFLSDVKLIFSTPAIRTGKSNANGNNNLSIVSKRQSLTVHIIQTSQRII